MGASLGRLRNLSNGTGPFRGGRTRSRVNVIADSASQNVYILPLKSCSS